VEAFYIDESTGARIIDSTKCTGCKLCIQACPQYPDSAIMYDPERNICVKCDLCGGDPLCVKFCPEAALSFTKREV
jgi:Fe-S-cluster-containing hydrogenase component 2